MVASPGIEPGTQGFSVGVAGFTRGRARPPDAISAPWQAQAADSRRRRTSSPDSMRRRAPTPTIRWTRRAGNGFRTVKMITKLEAENSLSYVLSGALRSPVQALCRHDEAAWTATDVRGLAVRRSQTPPATVIQYFPRARRAGGEPGARPGAFCLGDFLGDPR